MAGLSYRIALTAFAMIASLLLPGCLFGKEAVFTASGGVDIPDFSGTYNRFEKSGKMVVTRKADNVFEVLSDDNPDPGRVLVVPLDAPDTFLLQYDDETDYAFLALRHSGRRIDILTFTALVEESGEATEHFEAMFAKHGLNISNSLRLLETPSPGTLIAFFSECVADPLMMAEFESWFKM